MPTEKKAQIIDKLQDVLSKCSIGVLTDYRGLATPDLISLRRALRKSGVEYKVVKNTLAQIALERAGKKELGNLFEGPVAVALGYGDPIEPVKVLADYIRASKTTLNIKGGFLGDKPLTAKDVAFLASLPPKNVLVARVLGGLQSPIVTLVSHLAYPVRGLMGVLQARIKQLEGA